MGLIRTFVEEHGGTLVRTEGDATFAVFPEVVPRWRPPSMRNARSRRALRRTAPRSASGWGCTPARRTWPATTMAGSRSIGRRGSPARATVARSCSLIAPDRSSSTPCHPASGSETSARMPCVTCRLPSGSTSYMCRSCAPNSRCGPRRPVWANCRHGSRASSVARRMSLRSWHCWGEQAGHDHGAWWYRGPASRWKRRGRG